MKTLIKAANRCVNRDLGKPLGGLREAAIFSGLSDEKFYPFQHVAQTRSYKKGRVLYLQEDPAEFFYIICSGWVKLFHTMPEGEEVIIDMLTAGNIFGESAIFKENHHMCSAQIIQDAQLISIPSNVLDEQIRLNSQMAINMLYFMSLHHRRRQGELAFNATLNAPQRIGGFLLRLCPAKKNKDVVFHLPYDKTLIADTLGMKGATFSRALNILRQKTGIRIRDARVEVDSVERLAKFVYGSSWRKIREGYGQL